MAPGPDQEWCGQQDQDSDSSSVLHMYSGGDAKPQVLCPVLARQFRKHMEELESVQAMETMLVRDLGHKSCAKQLRKMGMFILEKRRLRETRGCQGTCWA